MHSNANRTEPITHWSPSKGYFTEPDVQTQIGNSGNSSRAPQTRGILEIDAKRSWVPQPEDTRYITIQPFVQRFADFSYITRYPQSSFNGNWSIIWNTSSSAVAREAFQEQLSFLSLLSVQAKPPDAIIAYLFDSALSTSGSLAHALSSLMWLVSSLAYYDQMPQFQTSDNVTQIFFTTVLYPQSFAGFWTIVVILVSHLILVWTITLAFARFSKYTLLGNYWQSIAQLWSPSTEDIIVNGSMTTDREVRAAWKAAIGQAESVGIEFANASGRYQLKGSRQGHRKAMPVSPGFDSSTVCSASPV